MLEFAHALTGGVIASKIANPLVSLPLALASHFLIDLLPHWNPRLSIEKKKYGYITKKTFLVIVLDCLFGLFLGLFLAFRHLPDTSMMLKIIAGCFVGILPDLIEAPFYFLNWKNFRLTKIAVFQSSHQNNVSFWPGMVSQIIFTIVLLSLI